MHQMDDAFQLAQRAYHLGKTEVHLTLDDLLLRFGGYVDVEIPHKVDVADQLHFHWQHFLSTQTCGAHILPAGRNMERVIAFRLPRSGHPPARAFCHDDQTTLVLTPSSMKNT